MSVAEAKNLIFEIVEKENSEDLLSRINKLKNQGEEILEQKARDILASTIQRLATSVSADVFTSTVTLPSDDMKGKIIGKEGRNIKTFERLTGVELLVDDIPVQLS